MIQAIIRKGKVVGEEVSSPNMTHFRAEGNTHTHGRTPSFIYQDIP